jgi:exodeoxyribonuclease VII small subunit
LNFFFYLQEIMLKKLPISSAPSSFENAMAELSALVAQMEAGDLALEASVSAYQRGSELIKYCADQLNKVEQQVKILDAGLLKPFSSDDSDEVQA